ncbi:hypothetical protein P7C70_g7034, partial [Phenoliferia sp. Uapishka_3]
MLATKALRSALKRTPAVFSPALLPHVHSQPVNGFVGAIGNTPLIRIKSLSEETGCEILGKAEFMNPGGSVKDRAALGLVEWAEKTGKIQPGGTIVEGTAGNTGIGLAHVCRARGYKCVIYMPNVCLSHLTGDQVEPKLMLSSCLDFADE